MKTFPPTRPIFSEEEVLIGMSYAFLFGVAVGFAAATFVIIFLAGLLAILISVVGITAILV